MDVLFLPESEYIDEIGDLVPGCYGSDMMIYLDAGATKSSPASRAATPSEKKARELPDHLNQYAGGDIGMRVQIQSFEVLISEIKFSNDITLVFLNHPSS